MSNKLQDILTSDYGNYRVVINRFSIFSIDCTISNKLQGRRTSDYGNDRVVIIRFSIFGHRLYYVQQAAGS